MNVASLLHALRGAGVTLSADGDQLHIVAPRGVCDTTTRDAMRTNKRALGFHLAGFDLGGKVRVRSEFVGELKATIGSPLWDTYLFCNLCHRGTSCIVA
jgi:hypothetical protein